MDELQPMISLPWHEFWLLTSSLLIVGLILGAAMGYVVGRLGVEVRRLAS